MPFQLRGNIVVAGWLECNSKRRFRLARFLQILIWLGVLALTIRPAESIATSISQGW
jgi:hypothetical protein